MDGVAYDIKEGQTWGEFKNEHNLDNNYIIYINSIIPFLTFSNIDYNTVFGDIFHLDFNFVNNTTNYLTPVLFKDIDETTVINTNNIINYLIFKASNESSDLNDKYNALKNITDFDNSMILYNGIESEIINSLSIVKYPTSEKYFEPFIYNFKRQVKYGEPIENILPYYSVYYPKNNVNTLIQKEFIGTILENSPTRFYIDGNLEDEICKFNENSVKFSDIFFANPGGYLINTGHTGTYFYNDTDILVFNDGEYTIAQLKEKYNIS